MLILPAIDLRGGRCVRLEQGDFHKETIFDDDPAAVARRFEADGAEWLHVVDLDGARSGTPRNLEAIGAIMRAVKISVEVGGGIRTTQAVAEMLDTGAQRVVVGTRAVREPEWLREVAEQFPARIALGLDAREGLVAVEGWGKQTDRSAARTLKRFQDLMLAAIVYTDIARDGMMSGPNVEATAALVEAGPFPVIASGGVTTVEDIRRLKEAGAAGAIIGRALYEGKLTLKAALEAAAT
ncbi:MAG TPA: 1-(5-phosphoribosyl)-5-[(5-phosphoribosylamino)methylideneamino]imidazole-4-carboxamide isomerase [Phycisphaerae bacterium]|nr:1-(5-phosphoribosyl)-5-[(5-phosphoribosylamino)methylideneamino]imidazole-4-carboxamide isomerase [Phycisphaerae bacterium]